MRVLVPLSVVASLAGCVEIPASVKAAFAPAAPNEPSHYEPRPSAGSVRATPPVVTGAAQAPSS